MSDDYLSDPFAEPQRAPRDIVRGPGLTYADLQARDLAAGGWADGETPGEVTTDVDGIPTGVAPTIKSRTHVGPTFITRAEADRLGVGDNTFKHVRIIDNKESTND